MKNLIETTVNFGGFYDSIHSYIIDDYIEVYEYNFRFRMWNFSTKNKLRVNNEKGL